MHTDKYEVKHSQVPVRNDVSHLYFLGSTWTYFPYYRKKVEDNTSNTYHVDWSG